MAPSDPRSWLDKAVGACFLLLVGAAAVFIAVKLIEAVITSLLIIIGIGLIVGIGFTILRARNRGW